jgi:hypothetical protein
MDVSSQLQAQAILTPQKGPPVATEQESGWAQGQSEHFGQENKFLPLLNTNCHITQLIAQS